MSEIPLFEQISAYLDGALSPVEKDALEEHMRQDPEARELYRQMAKISQGFDYLGGQQSNAIGALSVDSIVQEAQWQTYLQALWVGLGAFVFVSLVVLPVWFHTEFAVPSSATAVAGVVTEVSLSLQPESLEIP
ncbi:MAG: zf-HC2 domain-containing protein [Gloeobacterales cyanobacterium]